MAVESMFLDASGWIALLNRSDSSHVDANLAWRDFGRRAGLVFVTDWVIAETGNGLARSRCRDVFVKHSREFLASPSVRLVYIDGGLLKRAIDLYGSRQDKAWGLVDCASFVVMSEHGIRDAFTLDHHFEQAGFRRLLPGPGGMGD